MNTLLRKSIQQILLAGSTTLFAAGSFAAVGQQNPPPGPGHVPDYFGVVPNFANSPQPILTTVTTMTGTGSGAAATTYDYVNDAPTKKVMDVQGGTGYAVGDTVTVTDGGSATCVVTVNHVNPDGAIASNLDASGAFASSGVDGLDACTGFTMPVAGSGIRKFINALPGIPGVSSYINATDYNADGSTKSLGQSLPLAVADTTSFSNSDYYEIAEVEYTQKFHEDLPATHLRGYVQIKTGGFTVADFNASADKLAYASQYAHYLGPIIVAQKNRPVRIKLVNLLSTGAAGKLPIPVDHTYMGSDGAADTDNRTAMHLHGGNTPWISDGTARQWVKPVGEMGANKGESARSVPDMWFDASGNLIPNSGTCTQGTTTCTDAGATNNPGDGVLTFFYTNEQSARLMFYHDHAEGVTRLNVYDGMAGAYVLQDPAEQALVYDANTNPTGVLPPLADTIPLVIQEKTFVPNNTQPVVNFYGAFKSQLASQDPTWRWGTTGFNQDGSVKSDGLNGNGDLWVPHVFMPNQNPGDVSGANAVGRWDYGPWFWPPFANIQNGQIANPYYDPACDTTTQYCEGPFIPGVPNGSLQSLMNGGDLAKGIQPVAGGVHDATKGGAITEEPSGTPEAFNDTPTINGTAYPYINVDPKKYRLRMLSVGNDRMLNLSLVVAASKKSPDATAIGAANPANTILCDGGANSPANQADCTEVKMLPWNTAQDAITHFPTHWYTKQKAGITFDGRPSGVFDPATRGPAMVQIGTEGGFLSSPVVIKNQPVNYEYNPKNILIGNVKEKALFLGPAERADVVVDFSDYAGATLILYNDAPAPNPAWDLRLDYYTGGFDNTDTGGAFSVVPGYGPNSRTLLQIRVSGTGGNASAPASRDSTGGIDLNALKTAVQTAFKTSQEPIIVPQSAYNGIYTTTGGTPLNFVDALGVDLSRISDSWLTYSPLSPRDPSGNTTLLPSVKLELEPKSIIEDWTQNWGRMNALLGTEVPRTTATIQTSIPQAFIDPPTELVKITPNDNMVPISGTAPDGTQIWKITHNGVDAHAVHFHLFHVQIVNRVGWDGAIYAPDAAELGWKDTVIMNPLSDTIVALRPMVMSNLTFKVPNSHRLLVPQNAVGSTTLDQFNLNPTDGNASNVTNLSVNYGWEYLWHCHILGHEENDMMRTISAAQPPEAPSTPTATTLANGVKLDWTDNSVISNWVSIQRSTESTFATPALITTFNVVEPECAVQAGCARTYTDTTAPANTSVYYRIMANNTVGSGDGQLDAPRNPDGSYGGTLPAELASLVPGFTGYANVTANSNWSGTVSREIKPVAGFTPAGMSLAFADTNFGSTSGNTLATRQTVTITNTGNGSLNVSGINLTGPFARATGTNSGNSNYRGTCSTTAFSLTAGASCTYNLTFTPTAAACIGSGTIVPCTGTLTITDNSNNVPNSTQQITLTGNGKYVLPGAPNGLGTASVTQTGLTLNWTANTNTQSYTVQQSLTGANNTWATIATGVTANSLAVTGLNINTRYYFRVAAVNPAGIGAYSGSTNTTTLVNPVAVVDTVTTAANTANTNTGTQTITNVVNVRNNDTPNNAGTVTVVSGTSIGTGGATGVLTCTSSGSCSLALKPPASATSGTARQAAKRGTYTFTYTLTYGSVTTTATSVTITVQ